MFQQCATIYWTLNLHVGWSFKFFILESVLICPAFCTFTFLGTFCHSHPLSYSKLGIRRHSSVERRITAVFWYLVVTYFKTKPFLLVLLVFLIFDRLNNYSRNTLFFIIWLLHVCCRIVFVLYFTGLAHPF